MRLLLLAAGKSSRIYNKIKKNKCLININHKSLIRNIIDSAYKNKIEKIDIITGFKPNNIKKDLRNYKKIRFINNSKYSSTDMVYSALLGLKKTKIDTIISYTDIIYTDKIFKILSSNSKKFITIPSAMQEADDISYEIEGENVSADIKEQLDQYNIYINFLNDYYSQQNPKPIKFDSDLSKKLFA